MARRRRIVRMTRPRDVSGAEWSRLRREFGSDAREFNRQGRALLKDARARLRLQARDLRRQQREADKATRANLRILRRSTLFQPPRSAYRVVSTVRGPRRLLKRSYLRRSPKLKTAISQHQDVIDAARSVQAARAAQPASGLARLERRLFQNYPNARNYADPFANLRYASPAFLKQIESLSDEDLDIWIRTSTDGLQHMRVFAELIGDEPAEIPRVHPIHYKNKGYIHPLRM